MVIYFTETLGVREVDVPQAFRTFEHLDIP